MTNIDRHYRALELPKILTMLAEQTSCKDTYERALKLCPSSDYNTVCAELDKASDAHMLMARFGAPSLSGVRSPINIVRRAAAGGILSMSELLTAAEVLRCVRSLTEWRKRCQGLETALDFLFQSLVPNRSLEDKISESILSEDEMADNASPELADIRRKIKNAGIRVREQLDKLTRSSTYQKYLQESIITMRDGRYVVPVKAEYRNEIKGLVHDTSSSGATLFIEPIGVVEANNEIRVLQSKEEAEIDRILAELSTECGTYADDIAGSYECIIDIDMYFSKARLGYKLNGVRPEITTDGIIDLKKARHPLIDPKNVVPTDIRLGEEFDTLVVTGPNTGGKTVALKTLGLLTLMVMCGMLVPCADTSRISIFDRVLADIGDEQSIEQSLSTFSAHMTNIVSILEQAQGSTLVLLDELGAGTDPVEGAALAVAILDHLRWCGCKIAATTHYAELKVYALQTERVENACCEFDVATLRPTYKLLIGVPGRSNAFAISKRLGLGEDVIDRARSIVSSDNAKFEDVVSGLEKTRQSLEKEKELAYEKRLESERINSDIQDYKKKLELEKEKELDRARKEAQKLVDRVRYEAETLMDELLDIKKQKDTEDFSKLVSNAKQQFNSRLNKLDEQADPVMQKDLGDYVLPRELMVGDIVMLADIEQEGIVTKLPDKDNMVTIDAGILKTKTPLSNIRLINKRSSKKPDQKMLRRNVKSNATASAKTEIDIRGMNVEEALLDLDRFIDECVLLNIEQVTIIHGKGTGVLRSGVHSHLKNHGNIASFRLGKYGEGESGVTIVVLK